MAFKIESKSYRLPLDTRDYVDRVQHNGKGDSRWIKHRLGQREEREPTAKCVSGTLTKQDGKFRLEYKITSRGSVIVTNWLLSERSEWEYNQRTQEMDEIVHRTWKQTSQRRMNLEEFGAELVRRWNYSADQVFLTIDAMLSGT